jgi:mono/diheme cytochrome c family protein
VLGRASLIVFAVLVATVPASSQLSLSERAVKGRKVFEDRCYVCHQKDSNRVKEIAPALDGLFKRDRLIAGKPVTPENVKEVIKLGPTPGMPAFRYTLSDPEIDDLIEFLKTK